MFSLKKKESNSKITGKDNRVFSLSTSEHININIYLLLLFARVHFSFVNTYFIKQIK